jgi:hypothetical protein
MYKYLKMVLLLVSVSSTLSAIDDGPRMYWNAPVGTNILQTYYWTVQGNSVSPDTTQANSNFETDINLGVLGYNRIFDLGGRSTILSAIVTAGDITGSVSKLGNSAVRSSRGLGDLYLQSVVNIFGAPALSAEEYANYKQKTILSLLVGVTAPTGDYESDRVLNMGTNRWNMRLGLPFVQTLSSEWIFGEISTLEILPSVWFYGDNDNSFGSKLSQDPLYTLEAHFTRNITPLSFVSLDYFVQRVGDSYTDGIQTGTSHVSDSLGFTLSYLLNRHIQMQLRYLSTLNPDPLENELNANMFQFNMNYFWLE